MSFLDIVDIFSNLSLIGDKEHGTKRPRIYILFYFLLVPGIFWFVIELKSILNLPSPFLFLGLSFAGGLILTTGTIILIYKLKLIEILRLRDFFSILIPVTLLTISLTSFINH
jgi:prolipoprotein diacylglyceryltransferase